MPTSQACSEKTIEVEKMKVSNVVVLSTLLSLFGVAAAHHSPVVLYQLDQELTYEGVVTDFSLGNPHVRVYLMIEEPDGSEHRWMAEGGTRTVLLRNGWTEEVVGAGDVVKILGNPSRDGSRIIHLLTLTLPDGTELWGEDTPEDSLLEELRQRRR